MSHYINNSNILNFSASQTMPTASQTSSTSETDSSQSNGMHISELGINAQRSNTGSDLDRDAFLKLLVTQLQFQDPLEPMKDTDFIAQLAQFSALEQMQSMNTNTVRTQAFNMVGKAVMADVYNEHTNSTQRIMGFVEGVTLRNGQPYLSVSDGDNERTVSMDDLIAVSGDPTNEFILRTLSAVNGNLAVSQNLDLIGQYGQFIEKDSENDDEIKGFVEGKIDSIKFTPDGPVMVIGTKEVLASQAVTISPTPLLIGRVITGSTSDNRTITGPVKDVTVSNGTINLILEEGNVAIDNLTHVTDALRHVNTQITHDGTTGIVESVNIIRGVPHLVLDNGEEISYLDFAGIKDEEDDDD